MRKLDKLTQFEWDEGNKNKNWLRHKVTNQECEEIFFDSNKRILADTLHSTDEDRCILIGQTKLQRLLFIVFTIRSNKVRVISARDLSQKERKLYFYEKRI